MWSLRWVSGTYERGSVGSRCIEWFSTAWSPRAVAYAAVFATCAIALPSDARAAPTGVADRARSLIVQLEANAEARALTAAPVGRAKRALSQAAASPAAHAARLEDIALEWAEVARDLVRASEAERASDGLEQRASALAAEIAGMRAAVEQAMARVGRARNDVKGLEGAAAPAGAAVKESVAPARGVEAPAKEGAAEAGATPYPPAGSAPTREKK